MQSRFTAPGALSALVALAACSSGGSAPAVPVAAPVAAPTASAASGAALAPAQSAGTPSFTFASPGYVSPSTRSVTVTLTAVNGVAPAGSTHSLTTNLSGCATSCTVLGPSAPVGNDTFAFALHDAAGGAGKVLGVATQTLAIVAGNAAHASVAARGVPTTFAIQNIPTAQAGAPFAAPKPVKVAVKDADGNVISGTYAVTVWIDDLDSTHATSFTASGTDAPPAGQLFSSTDAVTLSYNGLAIAPATLMVSATNSTNFSATFAPVPSPLVYQGPTSQGNPQVDLYAAAGTGSSAAFSVSEQGWSNAPFGKSFSASAASSCAQIATVSPASGTSFTVRAVAAPTVGSCAVTVADGLGHSRVVTVTFSTTSFSGS
jgi:hypothetical protein